MREDKLERLIREHFSAHPDEAFTTDELCAVCYPGTGQIERKHRVAVLRAIDKALAAEPDWRGRRVNLSRGNGLVFYSAASVPSTAKGDCKRSSLGWPRLKAPAMERTRPTGQGSTRRRRAYADAARHRR